MRLTCLFKPLLMAAAFASAQLPALHAFILSVNPNVAGSSTERGVAFDITNNSTQSIVLTGLFNLPVTTTSTENYVLWTRAGTVLNQVSPTGTNWTDRGTATNTTGGGYASPTFTLTSFTFSGLTGVTIAPGETLGIYIKDTTGNASLRYVGSGSPASNTLSSTTGFDAGGSITYTGVYGLSGTGTNPTAANGTGAGQNGLNTPRNFIGQIEYTVSSVPEPSSAALLVGVGILGFVAHRRRKR